MQKKEGDIVMQQNEAATEEKQRLYVDMDGTLTVFTPVDKLETLYEKGYFLNQAPHENVLAAVREIITNHPDIEVHILSAVLADSIYAMQEKNEWLDRYLPEIDNEHRVFVPCGSNKKEGIQGGIRSNDFLLDDYTHNLNNWQPPARGIKLLNAINHTRGSWGHDRIRYDREPSDLAHGILSVMRSEQQIYDDKVNRLEGEEQGQMTQEIYTGEALDDLVIDKETGKVNVKLHPGKLVSPSALIESVDILYAVHLRDGRTLQISQEELMQIANVQSITDMNGLAQYEAIERKVEEVMGIVDTEKNYSITICRESGENVCNIVFRDREYHPDITLQGENLGVYFPALSEERLKKTVNSYLDQQEKVQNSITGQAEWKTGDQVSFYMSKYSFDPEGAYISGVQEVRGVLENTVYNETEDCNVYTIRSSNNFYSLAYGNEIYNKGQLMVLAAAQQKLPDEQFRIIASSRFNGAQMWEIYTGFQNGLSVEQVTKYARPEVPAWEMDVYRYGMQKGINYVMLHGIIDAKSGKVSTWSDCRQTIDTITERKQSGKKELDMHGITLEQWNEQIKNARDQTVGKHSAKTEDKDRDKINSHR